MKNLQPSTIKKVGDSIKASCRLICRPFLPLLPESFTNRLPFLGRVSIKTPDNIRIKFHTYGKHGKDRIAIKLARRGLMGYEGETIQIFLALAKEAQTVIDIGANTGLFALLAAAAKPSCQVSAFEPVPFIYDLLQENIKLNKLDNLQAIPVAVSDFTGQSTFYITRTSVGLPTDSSLSCGFRDQVDECKLETTTLDEYMQQSVTTTLDLLKIDVEATEEKVIRGALKTIEKHRPYIICEILENIDHQYIQQILQDLNYKFYHITPDGLEHHATLRGSVNTNQRNYLFVPHSKQDAILAICSKANILIRH